MRPFLFASLGLTAVLAIGGCATSDPEAQLERELDEQNAIDAYNRTAAPEDRIQCFRRTVHGGSIKKKVCMTAAQLQREQELSREAAPAQRDISLTPWEP